MNFLLCTDRKHPCWPHLEKFADTWGFVLTSTVDALAGGENLFLVSCTQFVDRGIRNRFKHVFVLHESDLPKGRGWSPLAWQILEGKNRIPVTLIEAADEIDAGKIIATATIELDGTELAPEIARKAAEAKIGLIKAALCYELHPRDQVGDATFYPRRRPEDSRLDPHKTIAEQFDLLRICEPRFPAFFDYRGCRYTVEVRK